MATLHGSPEGWFESNLQLSLTVCTWRRPLCGLSSSKLFILQYYEPFNRNWVPSILAPLQGCDERKLIQPILRTGRCERKTTRSTGFCIWLLACGMPPFQPRTNIENEYRGDYCLFARNLRDPTAPLVIFSAYVPSHNRVPFIQPEPSNKAEEVADVHHSCPPIFPRLSP